MLGEWGVFRRVWASGEQKAGKEVGGFHALLQKKQRAKGGKSTQTVSKKPRQRATVESAHWHWGGRVKVKVHWGKDTKRVDLKGKILLVGMVVIQGGHQQKVRASAGGDAVLKSMMVDGAVKKESWLVCCTEGEKNHKKKT